MPQYKNLSRQVSEGIKDVHTFNGPKSGRSLTKNTLGSTKFNFFSSDIAQEKGTPNAHTTATSTSVYEGSIGN